MNRAWLRGFGALAVLIVGGCAGGAPGGGGDMQDENPTGILVTTPAGSAADTYTLYDAAGTTMLEAALSMGEVEEVDPGRYVLTAYLNEAFVYATDVVVVAGQTTVVPFGAVNVVTVPGSEQTTYDIYEATGANLLDRAETDDIQPVPPGTYVLTAYFNAPLVYADNVVVTAGQVTTVTLGAVELTMGEDWSSLFYDVYAADGTTLLSRPESANELAPLPAGTYVIKDYFNELFTYASGVQVTAGQTTTFAMGAILYTGSEANYDLYDASGNQLLVRPGSQNEALPAPPGSYVLKDYFSDDVLATAVTVTAGQVTTVP